MQFALHHHMYVEFIPGVLICRFLFTPPCCLSSFQSLYFTSLFSLVCHDCRHTRCTAKTHIIRPPISKNRYIYRFVSKFPDREPPAMPIFIVSKIRLEHHHFHIIFYLVHWVQKNIDKIVLKRGKSKQKNSLIFFR